MRTTRYKAASPKPWGRDVLGFRGAWGENPDADATPLEVDNWIAAAWQAYPEHNAATGALAVAARVAVSEWSGYRIDETREPALAAAIAYVSAVRAAKAAADEAARSARCAHCGEASRMHGGGWCLPYERRTKFLAAEPQKESA